MSVFSVGVLVTLQWLQSVYQGTNMVSKNNSIDNVMIEVTTAFGTDDKYCNYILSSFPGNPNPNPNYVLDITKPDGTPIQKINMHDEGGNILGNVLTVGQPFDEKQNNLLAKSMVLKPIASLTATQVVAKLEFSFKKGSGDTAPESQRWIPVYATINPATKVITHCSTAGDSVMTLKHRSCEVSSDGYEHYDPKTDQCELNNDVQWYRSAADPKKIRCPAGSRPAVSRFDVMPEWTACRTRGNGGVVLRPRTYQSGFVSDSQDATAFVPAFSRETETCSFAYVAAVNPNDFVPEIKCVKSP